MLLIQIYTFFQYKGKMVLVQAKTNVQNVLGHPVKERRAYKIGRREYKIFTNILRYSIAKAYDPENKLGQLYHIMMSR